MEWPSPFPPSVSFCVVDQSCLWDDRAHAEELSLLRPGTVAKRKSEFAMGRIAARRALERFNPKPGPVLIGPLCQPLWPEGLQGSITHAAGHAAAAVAPSSLVAGLGLDVEDARRTGDGVEGVVADRVERAWSRADRLRVTLLFSAKESFFKAFFRFRNERFGFDAVRLTWTGNGFTATLLQAMGPTYPIGTQVAIRCNIAEPLVLTSLLLPARSCVRSLGTVQDR